MIPLAGALALLTSCYATRIVPPAQVAPLHHSNHRREIVLGQGPLGVRVGPRSWVRFVMRDGSRTPWFAARDLRVSQAMVTYNDGHPRPMAPASMVEGVRWKDLALIEVNDVDLAKSLLGITAGTGVVVMAATAELALMIGIGAITNTSTGELGITRVAVELVADRAFKRPEDDGAEVTAVRPIDTAGVPEPVPLFSTRARRRDLALFTFASEGGIDTATAAATTTSTAGGVAVGVRLLNVFELGVGARSTLIPSSDVGPARLVSKPFIRLGLHLDLDPRRRLGLAVGGDIGALSGVTQARFLYGVRVRLADPLQLGIYPWNPVGNWQVNVLGQTETTTSHLTMLDLTWLL